MPVTGFAKGREDSRYFSPRSTGVGKWEEKKIKYRYNIGEYRHGNHICSRGSFAVPVLLSGFGSSTNAPLFFVWGVFIPREDLAVLRHSTGWKWVQWAAHTKTVVIEQQETITKDSVTVKVNAVPWYRIADP